MLGTKTIAGHLNETFSTEFNVKIFMQLNAFLGHYSVFVKKSSFSNHEQTCSQEKNLDKNANLSSELLTLPLILSFFLDLKIHTLNKHYPM